MARNDVRRAASPAASNQKGEVSFLGARTDPRNRSAVESRISHAENVGAERPVCGYIDREVDKASERGNTPRLGLGEYYVAHLYRLKQLREIQRRYRKSGKLGSRVIPEDPREERRAK